MRLFHYLTRNKTDKNFDSSSIVPDPIPGKVSKRKSEYTSIFCLCGDVQLCTKKTTKLVVELKLFDLMIQN